MKTEEEYIREGKIAYLKYLGMIVLGTAILSYALTAIQTGEYDPVRMWEKVHRTGIEMRQDIARNRLEKISDEEANELGVER